MPAESYNKVAKLYTNKFFNELSKKPFDCKILKAFAKKNTPKQHIVDLGCGPGHITKYIYDHNIQITGLDVSGKMVEIARELNPEIDFITGDLNSLKFDPNSIDGFIAFYSLIHIDRKNIHTILKSCFNALKPGGKLLISLHKGKGDIYIDEFLGEKVSVKTTLYEELEMKNMLCNIGFEIEFIKTREPLDFEFQAEKIYIQCKK